MSARTAGHHGVLFISCAECRVFTEAGEQGADSQLLLLGQGTSAVLHFVEPCGDERQVFEFSVG